MGDKVRQVTFTETERQKLYELVQEDSANWRFMPNSEYAPSIIELNDGILKKFDDAPDL